MQLAYVLRNAMLALAVTPRLPRATSYAALASFFLTVFGYLWSVGMGAVILLVVYALIGTWWLLAAYWDRLGGRFADSSQSNLPVRPAVATLVGLLLASGLLIPLAGRSAVTTALAGFFPSSGGTQWSDPFAHGGVGDGDQMVAAKEQASSFGPIDSELFLESKMPSLYDAFNEFSEATPIKNKKRARRAIPLAPSQMKMNHQKTGTTQRSSREFSTVRQKTAERRNQEDRLSASLLLVKGRTPLHLALETYDRWDGRSLIASESPAEVATTLAAPNSKKLRWLNFSVSHPAAAFTADALSQVRVVNLKTDRVPTPAGTTGVTMTGLHAATMFKPARDGSLAMDVEHVPQLTVFEFRSALRDRSIDPELARSGSATDGGRIAGLAARWTDGVAPGWSQVETIIARLRSGYEHDRNAMVPADVEDAVEHFLFESRSGPDYLFAASTAVMLRSLGYDTRVRSGFYADPNRFDYKSRLTSVLAEDAHFWVEVRTLNGRRLTKNGKKLPGVWVTVEPTPGYRVLYAPESMLAWLQRNVQVCLAAVLARPVTSIAAVCFLAFVIASRRSLLDGLLIAWWSIRSRTAEVGSLARLTLRLIEWRAWAYRRCRPTGTTLGRWAELESHNDFVALASWALYGAGSAPLTTASARAACRRAVRTRFTKQDTAPIEPTAA
ncbi:MAG: transglutaminase-like domain-containing protein [Planctomycetota bacterium]